jgi:photosystem II stability/assembly factor-like uncharacterized protein
MRKIFLTLFFSYFLFVCSAQTGWHVCNAPAFANRIDDLFMVNTQTGYAVGGDGKIVKTTDGGENWSLLLQNNSVYCRSVEFINTQKGFVGSFPLAGTTTNILRRTLDGGASWTDLTPLLPLKARRGICGLAVADSNTIYGGGNYFQDSGYIIKSTDGGNSWNLIDMGGYASSIIDMFFLNKDTGFVTGKGPLPLETAVILYTTNGGASWTYKFKNTIFNEYCWKIQRLTKLIWYASIEDLSAVSPRILKSIDGGMTWTVHLVDVSPYNIEGIGFIDPKHGWTGGGPGFSFETTNGGLTWEKVPICPLMNRVFRLNDTTLFASGNQIWKYRGNGIYPPIPPTRYVWMKTYPNPVKDMLTMEVSLSVSTHVSLTLRDNLGRRIAVIDNTDRPMGSYQFYYNTDALAPGIYYVTLKTHEDGGTIKIVVGQ